MKKLIFTIFASVAFFYASAQCDGCAKIYQANDSTQMIVVPELNNRIYKLTNTACVQDTVSLDTVQAMTQVIFDATTYSMIENVTAAATDCEKQKLELLKALVVEKMLHFE